MPRKGWPLAPAFGGCGLDGAWRSAEVCHQEIDGEVWPRYNFKPLVFSQFRTAVDTQALGITSILHHVSTFGNSSWEIRGILTTTLRSSRVTIPSPSTWLV